MKYAYQHIRILVAAALLSFGHSAFAEQTLHVVTETWWPFNFKNQQGEIVGSSTSWVKPVLEQSGVPYKLAIMPWQRAYNLAKTTENVLIYSIFRSEEREHLFHWICPLPSTPIHKIYKLSERKDIVVNSEADLHQYSINVVRGAYTHEYLLELGLKKKLQLTSNSSTNVNQLLMGRVDLIVDFDGAMYPFLDSKGISRDHVVEVYVFKKYPELCMALSKGTPQATIERIKNAHQLLLKEKS